MPRPGRKRLTVDLPEDIHKQLKLLAKNNSYTITYIILRLIRNKLAEIERLSK